MRRYSTAPKPLPVVTSKISVKIEFHLPVLFIRALIFLLGVEPGNGRLMVPFPGQVKSGSCSPNAVARTAPAPASTAPVSCRRRTFNPSGLLLCCGPLQHGSTRLRRRHHCLSETSARGGSTPPIRKPAIGQDLEPVTSTSHQPWPNS
jgi:hypothetical protein